MSIDTADVKYAAFELKKCSAESGRAICIGVMAMPSGLAISWANVGAHPWNDLRYSPPLAAPNAACAGSPPARARSASLRVSVTIHAWRGSGRPWPILGGTRGSLAGTFSSVAPAPTMVLSKWWL